MCDIGHHTLLFELKRWQIYAAIRGQERKCRTEWETTRMLGFWYACGHRSRTDPRIEIKDVLKFPWEDDFEDDEISEEDFEYCKNLIDNENQ